MTDKRNSAIDFARGIVAISVVIGHLTHGKIGTFIFSFHMPFFFILSGYLFKNKSLEESFLKFVKRKALHLLLPLFVYRVIGIFFGIYAKEHTVKSILMALFWTPGAGYFFSSLFVAVIMLWCFAWISRKIEKQYAFCLYLLTSLITVVLAVIYNEAGWHDYYLIPIRLDTTLIGFVFCIIGYGMSMHKNTLEMKNAGGIKLILVLPLIYILAEYNGYVNIAAMMFGKSEVLYFGIAVIMFYTILLLVQCIVQTKTAWYKLMCKIGKNSMVVYLTHGYIFLVINRFIEYKFNVKVDRYSFPFNLIDFIFTMLIMVILIYVYENINLKLRRHKNQKNPVKKQKG